MNVPIATRRLVVLSTFALVLVSGSMLAAERSVPNPILVVSAPEGAPEVSLTSAPTFDFPRPSQDQSRPKLGVAANIDCGICRNWAHCNERGYPATCEYSPYLVYCTVPSTGPPPCESCYDSGPCYMQ